MVTLYVKRRVVATEKDARGNYPVTYADPTPWKVSGYAPGASVEPGAPNRDLSLILWTIYSPACASAPGELDRVVLGGVEYDVEGRPGDWTKGPWSHPTAGLVVELKRAEG